MNSAIAGRRWKKPDVAWLGLAVLAHALLLLIPLQPPASATTGKPTLSVSLTAFLPAATERKPVASVGPANNIPAPRLSSSPIAAAQAEMTVTTMPRLAPQAEKESDEEPGFALLTAAYLMETVRTSRLDRPPASAERQLGIPVPQNLPSNWQRGTGDKALQSGDNMFDGMVIPTETEIVDRWLAADGSHHVVVNLPNGQTLCGRAEAWSPLQPLVEHVMMTGSCGGGGKRTFSMAARESIARTPSNWENVIE